MSAVLEKGQSQLDWLWTNYSEIDPDDIALQSEVETQIAAALQQAVSDIKWKKTSEIEGQILGYNTDGELITSTTVDIPAYVQSATMRDATSEDEDYELETPLFSMTLSDGSEIVVDMSEFVYYVKSSSTIAMDLTDNVIYSELKLGVQDNTVVLQKTSDGLVGQLNIADESELKFDVSEGLSGWIPLLNTDASVQFAWVTTAQYLGNEPEEGTIYFIYDQPTVYLNGVQYGLGEKLIEDIIDEYLVLNYDSDSVTLCLQNTNGDIISSIDASVFIKDGMINTVTLETDPDGQDDGTYIHFVFNTDAGKEDIYVNVSSLIDVYTAGNGLILDDAKQFSVVIDPDSDSYLTVSESGIKLSGVSDAIDELTENLNTEISNRISADEELQALIDSLEERMDTAEADIDTAEADIDALETRMDTAESDIDSLEERMTTAESDIDSLETRMDTAESDIDSLETRMDTAEADIDTAETDIDALEERMGTAEADIDTAEADIDALETRMDTAESDIDSLEERMTTAESDIDTAEADIDSLEERMTTAESDIDTAESDIDSLEERMTTAESDIDTAEADIDSLEERMTTAESDIDTAEADIDALEERMNDAEEDIDDLEKTVDEHTTFINTNANNIATLSTQVATIQDTLADVQEDVESAVGSELVYDSESQTLSLVAQDDTVLSTVDASIFVKDGILSNVEIVDQDESGNEGLYFKFTFNTDADKEDIYLNAADLLPLYTGGDGITISEGVISVDLEYLETAIAAMDIYTTLIDADTVLQESITAIDERVTTAESDIDALETRMDTSESDTDSLEERMTTAETDIDSLEGRMDDAEEDIDDLESTISQHTTYINTNASNITTVNNQLSILQTNVSDIEEKVESALGTSLVYDSDGQTLSLVASDETILSSVDASIFVKDGILSNVEIVDQDESGNEGLYFKFTFNTDADKEDIYLNAADLLPLYTGGDGITISEGVISVDLEYLETAISSMDIYTELQESIAEIEERVTDAESDIDDLESWAKNHEIDENDIESNIEDLSEEYETDLYDVMYGNDDE